MAHTSFSRRILLLLASALFLPFAPSIFSVLIFFWPLVVSTVLAVLAVVSYGQQSGISAGQEEEAASENSIARLNINVSSAANTQKISDALRVGNQEVTWLEWLHNEDMEKCYTQGHRLDCMQAGWDVDDLDVVRSEASVDSLALSLEEKRRVDTCESVATNENFVEKQVEKAAHAIRFSSTDGACMTARADEKMLITRQTSPESIESRVDPFMLETEASVRHGMVSHMDAKDRNFSEDNGGPICKRYTEERHSKENTKGLVRDLSGDEEHKSSLRFSFFDNVGVSLNSSKA
ncbi:hypothetical protein GOP47_0002335 [Adiantum capillus-veneris]|uniref:Uncharacterized protein n=1 Tax=Adiantum capillus-veneris TaxID=13818 RepID=A0A9D4VAI0_ADICA|nr:hypothetical protein GOP47_0002335 [Adiantum capillus-veneris]